MRISPFIALTFVSVSPFAFGQSIVGGWDASTNSEATGLTYAGTGTSALATADYIFGSEENNLTFFNATNGTVNINNTGGNALDVTFRVDLTGSHAVTFDQFWVQMQRGGAGDSNVVANTAEYSTDGVTFTSGLMVDEVAVGGNGGGNNVGPYDTITEFREPNGFGGTIGPQQVIRISGLDAAGALDAGSLWIRYALGESSNTSGTLNVINDRIDLDTEAIALAAQNDTAGGVSDGFDVIWTGTAVEIAGFLEADFNQDGIVDLLDLDILGANWQSSGATNATGDANGDTIVDLLDLDVLGSQWQQSSSFAEALAASGIAVPEPASMVLLAAGGLLISRRRR